VGTSLADVDRKLIFATLELCGGVKKRAADILGISLKTLYNRLEEYGAHDGQPASEVSEPTAPEDEGPVHDSNTVS
jgi:two-component system response regulator AtoC